MADFSVPPEHSLPSYHEPTPETASRISREEEAELALKRTVISRGVSVVVTLGFLITLVSVPGINLAAQWLWGATRGGTGREFVALLPSWSKLRSARSWQDVDRAIPTGAAIKTAEKDLENDSIVSHFLLPRAQSFLTSVLHAGNEQAYPGRDGWLFYRPDVDYVIGIPFLDPTRLLHRARDLRIQPDPRPAIIDFRDQLAARGIRLILLPVPVKPSVEGDVLGSANQTGEIIRNASFPEFLARLRTAAVDVVDLKDVLSPRTESSESAPSAGPGRSASYLETDTHWLPAPMERSAEYLADFMGGANSDAAPGQAMKLHRMAISGLGDIATMLRLPKTHALYRPQQVTIHQVQSGNALWQPDPSADILLLGDSFSNIYSLAAMGWGESAGFAEHLSYALGRPIDCILRNSDGAFATREILSRELAKGRDRLAGKKCLVWEFSERELAFGDWKRLPMELLPPLPSGFYNPEEGHSVRVTGTVSAVSMVPRPGSVTYKDHILTVHLVDVTGVPSKNGDSVEVLAHLWSMRDSEWTPAARLRPGDRVKMRLSAWPGDPAREEINLSLLYDPALQLADPVWGELVD